MRLFCGSSLSCVQVGRVALQVLLQEWGAIVLQQYAIIELVGLA